MQEKVTISADFTLETGHIKPLHGVGQPPFSGTDYSLFHYLTEAHVPYSRLHDVGGWLGNGLWVDIPNLFRDFDADENDPGSYDFAFTDHLLSGLADAGVEPFFRLGVTIENAYRLKSYRVFPPADFHKWARICEHVIRHYNEGWAGGYRMGITYWEIWNEPDNYEGPGLSPMWRGTMEEYFSLYEITARHLKSCFGDSIRVGGYASCGFYALDADPGCDGNLIRTGHDCDWRARTEYFIDFLHGFLRHITSAEHSAPLDFFSWHSYADVPTVVRESRYIRRVLNHYGLSSVPDILNEWNTCHDRRGRTGTEAAAKALGMMLAMQRESVSQMEYYDARLGPSAYGGLFNPSTWEPYPAYYAFRAFGEAYHLGTEVYTHSDSPEVQVLGAKDGKSKLLLIANLGGDTTAEIALSGADAAESELLRIDHDHIAERDESSCGASRIFLPALSCVCLRFFEKAAK